MQVTRQFNKVKYLKKNNDLDRNWYVFYTTPRAEKKVKQDLYNRGLDVFLPVQKELRYWKNRQKKWIEKVIFPSYIFVYTAEFELHSLRRLPNIATFLHVANRPCTVSVNDIECIRRMIDNEMQVSVENDFVKGHKVKIVHGPLSGLEGILTEQKGKTRFGIQLAEINQTVLIDVCSSVLQKAN